MHKLLLFFRRSFFSFHHELTLTSGSRIVRHSKICGIWFCIVRKSRKSRKFFLMSCLRSRRKKNDSGCFQVLSFFLSFFLVHVLTFSLWYFFLLLLLSFLSGYLDRAWVFMHNYLRRTIDCKRHKK